MGVVGGMGIESGLGARGSVNRSPSPRSASASWPLSGSSWNPPQELVITADRGTSPLIGLFLACGIWGEDEDLLRGSWGKLGSMGESGFPGVLVAFVLERKVRLVTPRECRFRRGRVGGEGGG